MWVAAHQTAGSLLSKEKGFLEMSFQCFIRNWKNNARKQKKCWVFGSMQTPECRVASSSKLQTQLFIPCHCYVRNKRFQFGLTVSESKIRSFLHPQASCCMFSCLNSSPGYMASTARGHGRIFSLSRAVEQPPQPFPVVFLFVELTRNVLFEVHWAIRWLFCLWRYSSKRYGSLALHWCVMRHVITHEKYQSLQCPNITLQLVWLSHNCYGFQLKHVRVTVSKGFKAFFMHCFFFCISKIEIFSLFLEKLIILTCILYAVMHCVGSGVDCTEI